MKQLVILIGTFIIVCSISYVVYDEIALSISGKVAMSLMLIFTSITHFIYTDGLEMTIPDNFDDKYKRIIVLATGDLEIAMAAGLFIKEIDHVVAIFIMLYFLAIIPSNIIAAIKNVSIERANHTGHGLNYLWFRIPLQCFFMAWIYYFGVFIA